MTLINNIDQAVILAAGSGRRIGLSHPKALLEFAGITLLERSIAILYKARVNKIVIVTGYEAKQIISLVNDILPKYPNIIIYFVFNALFAETNNIYSLWLARQLFDDKGFILLNCDVIFHSYILNYLLNANNNTAISIDFRNTLGLEEMKVKLDERMCLKDISKQIDPVEALGEYIGLSKFGDNSVHLFSNILDVFIKRGDNQFYYENAIRELCSKIDISGISTMGLPWAEIDNHNDYENAKINILPKID